MEREIQFEDGKSRSQTPPRHEELFKTLTNKLKGTEYSTQEMRIHNSHSNP